MIAQSKRPFLVASFAATVVLVLAGVMIVLFNRTPNINGPESDNSEAMPWHAKAKEAGMEDEVPRFCEIQSLHNADSLVACLKEFANNGDVPAMARLGEIYYFGERVIKDYAEAYKWITPAAEGGHAISQFRLGWLYDSGNGVTEDIDRAIEWYVRAAGNGVPSAHWNLAVTYEDGPQELRSVDRAFSHYLNAAQLGIPAAFLKVGKAYLSGKGTNPHIPTALYWLEETAREGYYESMRLISLIYFEGLGNSSDFVEAYKWVLLYRRSVASELARRQAETAIDLIRSRLTENEVAEAKNRFKQWRESAGKMAGAGIIIVTTPPSSEAPQTPGDDNLPAKGDQEGEIEVRKRDEEMDREPDPESGARLHAPTSPPSVDPW